MGRRRRGREGCFGGRGWGSERFGFCRGGGGGCLPGEGRACHFHLGNNIWSCHRFRLLSLLKRWKAEDGRGLRGFWNAGSAARADVPPAHVGAAGTAKQERRRRRRRRRRQREMKNTAIEIAELRLAKSEGYHSCRVRDMLVVYESPS